MDNYPFSDKSYIDKVLKDFSTDNYYTKEEADKKFATFDDIASNVLFPDKIYEVTKPVGGFVKGAKINNITVSQMFTDLLGLEEYIEPIIPEHELPLGASELSKALFQSRRKLYTLDNSGELTEAPIIPEYYRITTNIEDPENDTSNYLYFILDSSNMVAEEGYQVFTPYNESDYWLTIFLPNEINQFDIKVYSTTKEWVTPNWTFQSIEHSNTPSGYTAYMADENYQVAPGVSVRIIFNREGEINNGR